MKFTIITLNDDRKEYKEVIRDRVPYEEVELPAVDGREVDLMAEIQERGLHKFAWGNAKQGELGVWLSNFDRWATVANMDEPLIVFEDDAIPGPHFGPALEDLMLELPDDWDFVALWVPENQRQDYLYDNTYDEYGHPRFHGWLPPEDSVYRIPGALCAAHVYQGYGMVALMYSPEGGQKLVNQARHRGIDNPVDCWVYEEAHKGHLKGFAPRPDFADLVNYDWKAESHVQLTERAE